MSYFLSSSKKIFFAVFLLSLFSLNLFSQSTVDNSRFLKQSVPSNMGTGESYKTVITFENNGTTTWLPAEYKLVVFGSGNSTDYIGAAPWNVADMPLSSALSPGQSISFEVTLTAPSKEGVYQFSAQMKHNDNFFGEQSKRVDIAVGPVTGTNNDMNSASFADQTVVSTMTAGAKYKASITMTNSGKTTWTPGKYRLVSLDAKSMVAPVWGISSVDLTEDIAPGATKVFIFSVTAPILEGTYLFQWRMSCDTGLFGDASKSVNVTVTTSNLLGK